MSVINSAKMCWSVVLLLFTFVWSRVGCAASCGGGEASELSLVPEEPVPGRYTLHWCTRVAGVEPIIDWKADIAVDESQSEQCQHDPKALWKKSYKKHSTISEHINKTFDCEKVCFNSTLDLVFAGCYLIKTYLHMGKIDQPREDHKPEELLFVSNQYNSTFFNATLPHLAQSEQKGNNVTVKWSFYPIPVEADFVLELRNVDNESDPVEVQQQCTCSTPWQLECELRDLSLGRYELTLQRRAPWTDGDLFPQRNVVPTALFSVSTPLPPPTLQPASVAVYWLSASCVLVCAVSALAAWWFGPRAWALFEKKLRRHWVNRNDSESPEGEGGGGEGDAGDTRILLLYARDHPHFMSAMKILRELLEELAPGQVHDVFGPSTVGEYACAPGAWLRHAVSRARVVLVETPAAAELYSHVVQLDDAGRQVKVIQPLLGSRVQYREPQYGDDLLKVALQLVRETAYRPSVYSKYYVASVSELPVDMLSHVVPFRRYPLPHAAHLLLRDLAPRAAAPSPDKMAALHEELARYVDHVRDHPDYLQELLTFW